MEINLEYLGDNKFNAKTAKSSFILDAKEITPVEYFAIGIIGCTGVDLVTFADKDGYLVNNYSVKAQIQRQLDVPYKFKSLHVIYKFDGSFDDIKAKRYILASLESYCTTINSIRDSVEVFYTIIYNGKTIANKESIISGGGSNSGGIILDDGFGGACCS
jgi:putative redox protein